MGHTFIELLIAMGIFGLLVLIVNQFYLASSDGLSTMYAQATLQSEGAVALRSVMGDTRQARARIANGTACPAYAGAQGAPFTAGANVLCLTVPSIDANGLLLFGCDDTMIYDFTTTNNVGGLRRTVTPNTVPPAPPVCLAGTRVNSQRIIASYVTTPPGGTFPIPGDDPPGVSTVICQLTAQKVERGRTYSVNVASRARLGNQ